MSSSPNIAERARSSASQAAKAIGGMTGISLGADWFEGNGLDIASAAVGDLLSMLPIPFDVLVHLF